MFLQVSLGAHCMRESWLTRTVVLHPFGRSFNIKLCTSELNIRHRKLTNNSNTNTIRKHVLFLLLLLTIYKQRKGSCSLSITGCENLYHASLYRISHQSYIMLTRNERKCLLASPTKHQCHCSLWDLFSSLFQFAVTYVVVFSPICSSEYSQVKQS